MSPFMRSCSTSSCPGRQWSMPRFCGGCWGVNSEAGDCFQAAVSAWKSCTFRPKIWKPWRQVLSDFTIKRSPKTAEWRVCSFFVEVPQKDGLSCCHYYSIVSMKSTTPDLWTALKLGWVNPSYCVDGNAWERDEVCIGFRVSAYISLWFLFFWKTCVL